MGKAWQNSVRSAAAVLTIAFLGMAGVSAISPAAAAPKVVVSIKPLHSLATGVMAGVGAPELLLKGAATPHSYAMKPSDVRSLLRADLVIWVGAGMESFLSKPIRSLSSRKVLELHKAQGVTLLKAREGGIWEPEADAGHGYGHGNGHGHNTTGEKKDAHAHGAHDMHIWLSPANAKAMTAAIAAALSKTDPDNAARYAANAARLTARIETHDAAIAARLAPVKDKPFIVFHDAYQFFEKHYGLAAAGSITVTPDRKPSPRRLYTIRKRILEQKVRCVFNEPQFPPALVATVIDGTPARTAVLDPLGASLPAGEEVWFGLMSGLADEISGCLGN